MFDVRVHPKVAKLAPKVLKPTHLKRLIDFIQDVKDEPIPKGYDVKPLTDRKLLGLDAYRLRLGDYRLLYAVDWKNKIVYVVRLEPRSRAYKRR
ncbi:type II toxin-antitoxin system RelE family toxin [Thermococcus sp.]